MPAISISRCSVALLLVGSAEASLVLSSSSSPCVTGHRLWRMGLRSVTTPCSKRQIWKKKGRFFSSSSVSELNWGSAKRGVGKFLSFCGLYLWVLMRREPWKGKDNGKLLDSDG